jgi:hypothetical protein
MEYAENETEAVYGRLQGESSQGDAEGRKDSKENLGNARFMLMESAIYIEEQNDGKENGGNARASTTRTRAQSHSGQYWWRRCSEYLAQYSSHYWARVQKPGDPA